MIPSFLFTTAPSPCHPAVHSAGLWPWTPASTLYLANWWVTCPTSCQKWNSVSSCHTIQARLLSPSLKSSQKVKSKVRTWKDLGLGTWTLLTVLSLHHPPTTTTVNFSDTSRGPIIKCYTFLETSHDPQLGSQLRCKNFANFFATLFCKPT